MKVEIKNIPDKHIPNNQIDRKGHRGMNTFAGCPKVMSSKGVGL